MTCATTEICGGAVVAQVAQKAGLRHCATTHLLTGGMGGVAQVAHLPCGGAVVAPDIDTKISNSKRMG
jgi:hypothetical protein